MSGGVRECEWSACAPKAYKGQASVPPSLLKLQQWILEFAGSWSALNPKPLNTLTLTPQPEIPINRKPKAPKP